MREEDAKSGGREVQVGKFPFTANSKAPILNWPQGWIKVIGDKQSGDALGVHRTAQCHRVYC